MEKISQIAFIIFLCFPLARAAGEIDPTFNAALIKPGFQRAQVTAAQPDGKIISYGIFSSVSGVPVPVGTNLVRLNADGTLDTSFNALSIGGVASVTEIALQSNGKIIISGFIIIGNQTARGIIRLNTDGTLDNTFVADVGSTVFDVEVLSDDKIIAADGVGIKRLLPDGALETNIASQTSLWELGIQPDGKILAADSGGTVRRYNMNGGADSSFLPAVFNHFVWDIRVQADGKILIGGQFTTLNGSARRKVARLNANGSDDASFNAAFGDSGFIIKMIPLPDGKVLAGGKDLSNTSQSNTNKNVWRLNTDGSVDINFTQTIDMQVYDLDRLANGQIMMSGDATPQNHPVRPMYRLNPDGDADLAFRLNFGVVGEGRKIFVQPDGKILVGGLFSLANNFDRPSLTRFNVDGSVDTGFNPAFFYNPNDIVTAIDVQPDGKIIIGAYGSSFDARRLNPDGSPDIGFTLTSFTNDVKVLSSGKILIGGANFLKLFNSDGTLDSSFNVTLNGFGVEKFAVQPDGKIVIVGTFTLVNSVSRGRVARLNADGTLDNTFDTSNGANAAVLDVALQTDGKILIGGLFTEVNSTSRAFLARLNANGTLDTGFVPNLNDSVRSIQIQPNNKILIGGLFTIINGFSRPALARLNSDGNVDPAFYTNGASPYDIELQSDGKILVVGGFSMVREVQKYGIVRLENSLANKTAFDYDGDGKADVSVFRPSTNRWYVFKSSDSTVSETTFGLAGDVVAPADFDGDGKTDLGIFRASSGDWWYRSSFNGTQISVHWGASGDIPRPSDFDGDGKADYIIFRPPNNVWYRFGSTGATSITPFGLAGDKPVSGDFDGDGKSDLAIFRPSTGDWWYQSSINGAQLATRWGISTDVPAPADFDGDGKTDFAVYRPSTGVWYVINSSSGSFLIMNFGIAEDKPVPADYDGDGKADIAVFRPSTGTWYQMKTTEGFAAQQFGVSSDVPTENAFVP